MKRIFELTGSDLASLDKAKLTEMIRHSEGRTVMAETVVVGQPLAEQVSNAELAASFGADLITLNLFNCELPFVFGIDDLDLDPRDPFSWTQQILDRGQVNARDAGYVRTLRRIIGRPLGLNLEPIPPGLPCPSGCTLNETNLAYVRDQGFDYLVITANPNTGVGEEDIAGGIRLARQVLGDDTLIIAGKMHGAGTGSLISEGFPENLIIAGADVILLPAPGTVPGFSEGRVAGLIEEIHRLGALAMTAVGTSQEGASIAVTEQIALMAKMAGADILHTGDAGQSGMTIPENIMALSMTIRGRRHTYRRMGCSMVKGLDQ